MIKIIKISIFVLIPLFAIGQKRVYEKVNNLIKTNSNFEKISLFEEINNDIDVESAKIVRQATFASLNVGELNKIVQNKYQTIELQIPYRNQFISIQLYQVNIFSADGKRVLNSCPYKSNINIDL